MNRLLLIPLLTVALVLPGCGDDDDDPAGPDPITMADLAGTWTATEFRAISLDDPQLEFELISAGGAMGVTVQPDGTFQGSISVFDPDLGQFVTIPIGGTFALTSQTEIYADFTVEIPPLLEDGTVEFTYSGSTLTLHQDVTNFDFDADGTNESASFDATLVRQ